MSLPEIFRPKTRSELVGNKKSIDRLEECILSGKTCLIDGQAGIGKTTSVYVIANEINFEVREWNASDSRKKDDIVNIIRELRCRPLVPTIFLLDEVDGAEDFKGIEKCIKSTANPLILICNDQYKIPKTVSQLCERIHFYPPYTNEVSTVIQRIAKATGKKADYSHINGDIRNSILKAFYGSEKYQTLTIYDEVENFFKKGEISSLNQDHFIWLVDNASLQLNGRAKFNFYQLLNVCDKLNSFTPLKAQSFIGKSKIEYPRFIKRAKILKRKN